MTNLKRAGIIVFLLISFCGVKAQMLNTGISFDLYGISITKFPSDVVFSETSYKAYYTKRVQAPAAFQQNYGFNLIADYYRFFVNGRAGLTQTIKGTIYKFSYPIAGNDFLDYYTKITYGRTDLSLSFGYYFKAKSFFRPYVETGFGRTSPYIYREDFSDDKKFKSQWTGRHEIKEYMNLYRPYNYVILGYGYRGDMFSVYSRYNIRLGKQNVFYSNLALGIGIYTNFSKLRKHYIYQPEE